MGSNNSNNSSDHRRQSATTAAKGSSRKGRKPRKAPAGAALRWRRGVSITMSVVTALLSVGLQLSAYAGYVRPSQFAPSAVMQMTLPLWALAVVAIAIIDLIWWRWQALIALAAMALSAGPLWDLCPLNIGGEPELTPEQQRRAFTLMSYNVADFNDFTESYPSGTNPTISYILREDADVVCLQELEYFCALERWHVTAAQIDSLHRRYPYVLLNGHTQAIMSKYPVESLPLDFKHIRKGAGDMAAYRIMVEGTPVNIFNLHLGSFNLTGKDKELYRSVTRLGQDSVPELRQVKNRLYDKVVTAALAHEQQAEHLLRFVKHYGGERAIICGDFNDVPGCYALRRLSDADFRQVYPALAFGPTITFHANRFYFRIDHVLWRGKLTPLSIKRGDAPYSDHYPLTTKFLVDIE